MQDSVVRGPDGLPAGNPNQHPDQAPDAPKDNELVVVFDPATQGVAIRLKTTSFKSWAYVAAILGLAADEAKRQEQIALARMQAMQMAEAQQAAALAGRINGRRLIGG